ncbi:hypothetical protein [Microbacterium murale]|uniref:Lipoprotein n=1 Tax=Microbacterium murale TaxID=1081040 RepID=A0ABQ1RQ19_9MICO|nr:hypothetical protein [Microbacterium murale]GGD75534.1 hypothetical protein GCM10007269_18260 [Microbacterium murale]
MTSLRTRSTARHAAIAIGAALLLVGATGCTAIAGPDDEASNTIEAMETATPTATPPTAETTAADDEATCSGFADIQTILLNADTALHQDRMGQKERNAWYSLASRFLGNIPLADEGPVAEALATLKQDFPAVQDLNPTDIGSEEWYVAAAVLFDACDAAGFTVITNAFTGG